MPVSGAPSVAHMDSAIDSVYTFPSLGAGFTTSTAPKCDRSAGRERNYGARKSHPSPDLASACLLYCHHTLKASRAGLRGPLILQGLQGCLSKISLAHLLPIANMRVTALLMGTGELGRGGHVPGRRLELEMQGLGRACAAVTRQLRKEHGTGKHGSVSWRQGARCRARQGIKQRAEIPCWH